MRWRSGAVTALALALLLVGCGSSTEPTSAPTSSAPGESGCVTDAVIEASRTLVPVDLAGTGHLSGANFYAGSGACKNLLLAQLEGQVRSVQAPIDLGQRRVSLRAITVPGRQGQLLLAVAKHPRGGFQAYLFGYADGSLAQLTVHGRPVIPFVATDTGSGALATHCTRNGIQVDTARERGGSWTVYRTTYAVVGNSVTAERRTVQRTDLTEAKLDQQYGALIRHDLFEDCG